MQKFVIAAALVAAFPASAFAAGNTSTASGTASATVVSPLVLTHTSGASLNFGKFTDTAAGSISISSAGVVSVTGGVNNVTGVTQTADQFSVAGDTTRTFAITTTGGTVANGAVTIPFTTTPSTATGTLASGAASFTVGGTLTLAGTEAAGTYTGTYSATVTYN